MSENSDVELKSSKYKLLLLKERLEHFSLLNICTEYYHKYTCTWMLSREMKGAWLITICKFETNLLILYKGRTRIVFGQICLHTSYLHEFIEHAVWNHPSLHKNWINIFF